MHQRAFVAFVTLALLLASATFARDSVNKSIRVSDGETVDHNLSSVNGSITVGASADLQQRAKTVNGRIAIDSDSRTRDLASVNGAVRVGDRVNVDGDLTSVNGGIQSGQDSVVTGSVETVNGAIKLSGTTVHKNIETINGRVVLDQGSRVEGNLIIEDAKSRSWDRSRKPLEIELRNGSVIDGDVRVLDDQRKVIVRLSGGSSVKGQIEGAEVVQE